jgi:hypothetical protein
MAIDADISPELARKGLEADARNSLAELAKGGTLPPAKRAMLEMVVAAGADPVALAQKRRSRLLHIYITAARRLTEAEMDEIAEFLPSASAVERRVTKERFTHSLDHYATVYGYAVRNVKKWLGIGREKTPLDLPPLDTPALMPAWWTRNMKQRCPPRLLQAASAAKPAATAQTLPAAVLSPPPAVPPNSAPADGALKSSGYAGMIERATHSEVVAWQAWQDSLKADPYDASNEEMRRRAYDRACEQARKVLKDRDSGLAGDTEWGRWDDMETVAQEHVSVLNQSLRSSPVRVATKLALPPELFRKIADAWNAELDRIFDALDAAEWRKPLADAAPVENFQLAAE